MSYIALSCRVLLGTVFLVSGLTKVAGRGNFRAYARSVRRLGSLPRRWILPVARALVSAELAVVCLLAIPVPAATVSGCVLAGGLLVVFSAVIVRSLRNGDAEPCRCFGASTAPLGRRHVLRNAVLAGAALLGPAPLSGAGIAGLAVASVVGLVLGWLVTELDRFAELFGPSKLSAARRSS